MMQPAQQPPTDQQKIEALSNEVTIIRQANANLGSQIAAREIEQVRWQMTSDAQVKLIAELRQQIVSLKTAVPATEPPGAPPGAAATLDG